MSFNSSSFYLPNTLHSVSRQAHPLPLEGLGEAVFWVAFLLSSAPFLSISFLLTFPSTPFCILKDALLQCKRASFDV